MTKAELARQMQRILALPAGTVLSGTDRELAAAVIAMHPSADEKVGPGIDRLVVRDGDFGGHELHIIRTDGTEVDISYRRALAPRTAATERADLLAALRQEVANQIVHFKRDRLARGATFCAVSGIALDPPDDAHVDHAPPWTFTALADAWLKGRPTPELESAGGRGRRLADRELAADWQRFHLWSSRLRLVHRDINSAIATARQRALA